jgi:hypothetical protein
MLGVARCLIAVGRSAETCVDYIRDKNDGEGRKTFAFLYNSSHLCDNKYLCPIGFQADMQTIDMGYFSSGTYLERTLHL